MRLKASRCARVPQARARGSDAGVAGRAGHLDHDHRRAAHRPRAEVHQVVVAGNAIDRRVLRHRRDDDPVLQRHAAQRERRQHRRDRAMRRDPLPARRGGDPVLVALDVDLVAQAQVLVADALAARQQRVGELLGRQVDVTVDMLEPLGRVARRVLDLQHLDAAQVFVVRQRGVEIERVLADRAGELDRVFERELGARADREVRGVRRVAHQHHRRSAIDVEAMHPALADDARELDPLRRAAQVRRVRQERMALQGLREQLLAEGDRLLLLHLLEAGLAPDLLRRLDDEGRVGRVEPVGVRLEPAVLGLLEIEGEGVEQARRAEPDKAVAAHVDVGPVGGGVLGADAAVEAVAGDDEIGVGVVGRRLRVGLEHQLDADFLAARLQDVEQALATDAAEAVAARRDPGAADVDLDVVPVVERVEDLCRARRVGRLQVAERLVGEDDTPAERVVGLVALDDDDLVRWVLLLHQQREIETRRAAADADDLHIRLE